MNSGSMKRRKFLKVSGATLGLVLGGWATVEIAQDWIYADDWIYRLTGMSKDDPQIQAFAKKCADVVSPGSEGFKVVGDRLRSLSKKEFRAKVAASVQEDYRDGRVEDVGGWVLSRTEVELFALGHQFK